jgi:hypothetical protein
MHIASSLLPTLVDLCIGRRNDFACQRSDGSYYRVRQPLTYEHIAQHIAGDITLGSYVITEADACQFAVFDCDKRGGLIDLVAVQERLRVDGIPSYLEASRRGGHLWVFFASSLHPAQVRHWLLFYCPEHIEFYPKQNSAVSGLGSLVRVPLGVHQVTGKRYPFVELIHRRFVPVAQSIGENLAWLSTVERASVPPLIPVHSTDQGRTHARKEKYPSQPEQLFHPRPPQTNIRAWCAQQDAVAVIGKYVDLDQRGMGHCPFPEHHAHGVDRHPSFWVYQPQGSDLCCWYCHTWGKGGSVFDFLRLYYGLDGRTLWQQLCAGSQF